MHSNVALARDQRDALAIDSLAKAFPVHKELGPRITLLAYELLKRHAKSGGLRTLDALVAATAIADRFTLVSKNRKHFHMIDELISACLTTERESLSGTLLFGGGATPRPARDSQRGI